MTESEFLAELESGTDFKDLLASSGVPKSTAYKWRKAALGKDDTAEVADVETVDVPGGIPTTKKSHKKIVKKNAPISEQSAGAILEGLFVVAALLQQEQEWLLSPEEKNALAVPAAEALANLPTPIAQAVNRWSAPGVFATTLITIVISKSSKIAHKRTAKLVQLRVAPQPGNVAPPMGQQQQPTTQQPSAPLTNEMRDAALAASMHIGDGASRMEEPKDVGEMHFE